MSVSAQFTVYFEGPFWVGVLESEEDGRLVVARHVFGAEPSNAELLQFMLYRFHLVKRCRSAATAARRGARAVERLPNPKRAIREARREMSHPVSSRAQAALSTALAASKAERAVKSRDEERAAARRRFELRSEKRAEKRRGH